MDNVLQYPSEFERVLREMKRMTPEEKEKAEQEVLDALEAAYYDQYHAADEY